MKPQRLLLAAIALAILMMAFIGISAYTEGDPIPTLTLFLTGATPLLTAIAVMLKDVKVDKTLAVSRETDKKVDDLLNGSMQGKISRLESHVDRNSVRMGHIETVQIETLAEIRALRVQLNEFIQPGPAGVPGEPGL